VRKDRLKPGEGVNGDPTRASAALGNLGVDAIVSRTVAVIKDAVARR
jgi:creatinine amidohydrolase/Fe(II)-dependent formamide hydrolase-like protein